MALPAVDAAGTRISENEEHTGCAFKAKKRTSKEAIKLRKHVAVQVIQ